MSVSVILFKNNTCVPCAQFEPVFNTAMKAYEGRVEVRVSDISKDASLAIQYGVMGVPTLVILKDDTEVSRLVGAVTGKELTDALAPFVQNA